MLRLRVALLAGLSECIASRCRRHWVCMPSFQTPRMIMYSDPVMGKRSLETMP